MSSNQLPKRLQKYRVILGRILIPLVLIYLFWFERIPVHLFNSRIGLVGVALVALGVAIRSLSAGMLHKNEQLASSGIYAVVRNPLYLGSLVMLIGVNLLIIHPLFLLTSLALFLLTYVPTIRNEERGLAARYGKAWVDYASSTPRLLPRLSRIGELRHIQWSGERWYHNHEHNTVIAAVAVLLLLQLYSRWVGG